MPHKHARSLLDLPLGSRFMQNFLRFRMGVHRLPEDEGSWREYLGMKGYVCFATREIGSLCNEKHIVFQCTAPQGVRDEYAPLFSEFYTMKQSLWQDDLVSVANIYTCVSRQRCSFLQLVCPMTARHLISLMWLEEM